MVLDGSGHGRDAGGLDADHFDVRTGLLDGAGDAADEATAADGDHDGVEVGDLLEEFETDGSLASDDEWIVEGVDEGHGFGIADAAGFGRRPRRSWPRGG